MPFEFDEQICETQVERQEDKFGVPYLRKMTEPTEGKCVEDPKYKQDINEISYFLPFLPFFFVLRAPPTLFAGAGAARGATSFFAPGLSKGSNSSLLSE